MSKTKVFIEVDEDAVEKLDEFIKKIYTHKQRMRDNQDSWYGENDLHQAKRQVKQIKPIAKSFGLYPYNQPKVSMNMDT